MSHSIFTDRVRSADLPLRRGGAPHLAFARQLGFLVVACAGFALVGCGSGEKADVAATQATPDDAPHEDAAEPQPTEIVSQFLDRMRRGGDESRASDLLTKLAQQEMTRIGRPLQLPGSPDTRYEVRKAFPVPGEADAMWVHTVLSEPVAEQETLQYEVVWTLRKEIHGWRISGFVVDQGDQLDPLQIDFENGDEMAARLSQLEQEPSSENR